MGVPETKYARSGKVSIGYQVLGEGPPDLVFVPRVISNVEYAWHLPRWPPGSKASLLLAVDLVRKTRHRNLRSRD